MSQLVGKIKPNNANKRPLELIVRESETTIKIKFAVFRGGGGWAGGAEGKIVPNAIFHGKRHDNKILKVKILLS